MYTKIQIGISDDEVAFLNAMRLLISTNLISEMGVNNTAILVKLVQPIFEDIKLARAFVSVCRYTNEEGLRGILDLTFQRVSRLVGIVDIIDY